MQQFQGQNLLKHLSPMFGLIYIPKCFPLWIYWLFFPKSVWCILWKREVRNKGYTVDLTNYDFQNNVFNINDKKNSNLYNDRFILERSIWAHLRWRLIGSILIMLSSDLHLGHAKDIWRNGLWVLPHQNFDIFPIWTPSFTTFWG